MPAITLDPETAVRAARPANRYAHVVERLQRVEHLTAGDARRRFEAMLAFLDAAAAAGDAIAPSTSIDTAWHAFLLRTRNYADYCQTRFGRFIHHRPEQPATTSDCTSEEASCNTEGNCTADRYQHTP